MFGCWDDGGNGGGLGALPVTTWTNSGPGGLPSPPTRQQDLATCLAYVEKYKRVYGRTPNVWCVGQTAPAPSVPIPDPPICAPGWIYRNGACTPPFVPPPPPDTGGIKCAQGYMLVNGECVPAFTHGVPLPPVKPVPAWWRPRRPGGTVGTSPAWGRWMWRRRRPPIRRPWIDKRDKPAPPVVVAVPAAEICPIRGYVSRAIPGANEYQNFRCTPGQPVTIDAGLAAAGRQDALARGLSDLGDFTVGNVTVPTWALLAGAGVVALMFMKGKRR